MVVGPIWPAWPRRDLEGRLLGHLDDALGMRPGCPRDDQTDPVADPVLVDLLAQPHEEHRARVRPSTPMSQNIIEPGIPCYTRFDAVMYRIQNDA